MKKISLILIILFLFPIQVFSATCTATNTAEIASCFATVESGGGGTVTINSGTFTLSPTLQGGGGYWGLDFSTNTNHITINGAGVNTTILKWPNATGGIVNSPSLGGSGATAVGASDVGIVLGDNITLQNFTFDGNKANQTVTAANEQGCTGIQNISSSVAPSTNINISSVEIKNTVNTGALFNFLKCPSGAHCTFTNFTIHDTFSDNTAIKCAASGYVFGSYTTYIMPIGLQENQCSYVDHTNINVYNCGFGGMGWKCSSYMTISGTSSLYNNGIGQYGSCWTGNTWGEGIYIDTTNYPDVTQEASSYNTIDGATVYENTEGGIQFDNYSSGGTMDHNTIQNCTIYSNYEHGIMMLSNTNTTIYQNTVYDNGAHPTGISSERVGGIVIGAGTFSITRNDTYDSREGDNRTQLYGISAASPYGAPTSYTIDHNYSHNNKTSDYDGLTYTNDGALTVSAAIALSGATISGGTLQ